MKRFLAVALLLSSLKAVAQNEAQTKTMYPRIAKAQAYEAKGFHPLDCFAGQVRIRGKRLSRLSFTVFRPDGDMKCCGEIVRNGWTDSHGHFVVEPLAAGEHFAQFESKGTEYTASFAVMQKYDRCGAEFVELNFTAANQYALQTLVTVDGDEKDCSEDDPGCYRR
jgi:hypothetical protein